MSRIIRKKSARYTYFEPQHRIHRQIRKIVLILRQHLRGQRRLRDIHKILPKPLWILRMILRRTLQRPQRSDTRDPIPLHDRLRMNLLADQPLRLPQTLGRKHTHARRPIAHFVVLDFGDVDEDLGGGVVELDRLEDRGAVVGYVDVAGGAGLEDLVHAFGTESGFDEVPQRDRPYERGETRVFGPFFGCLGGK